MDVKNIEVKRVEVAAYRFVSFDYMKDDAVVFPKDRFAFSKNPDSYLEDALVTSHSMKELIDEIISDLKSKKIDLMSHLKEDTRLAIEELRKL